MKCYEIIKRLEEIAPPNLACDWDNVGLLVGNYQKEVHKIYIALDVTKETMKEAIEFEADMIITHHPLIFSSLKKITNEHFIGERIYELIRHDISYYAMHTNFDITSGGMGDLAADKLGLIEKEPISITSFHETEPLGIGKVGILTKFMTLKELSEFTKRQFQLEGVVVYGDINSDEIIKRVAVSPGSGRSSIKDAIKQNAQVLITGDIGHHEGIDGVAQGLKIIDAGHYGLEYVFVPFMKKFLEREWKDKLLIGTATYKLPNTIV